MFKLLDYKPKSWSPVDSIVWAKYMAWGLTNFFDPVKLSYVVMKLGYEDVNTLWACSLILSRQYYCNPCRSIQTKKSKLV